MFVLLASNGRFYTGRADMFWLSIVKSEAFAYSEAEASRKCALFNGRTALSGLTFTAVEV